ncbi:MAG: hypothetical protein QM703_23005 [Gemmatales bacterium]
MELFNVAGQANYFFVNIGAISEDSYFFDQCAGIEDNGVIFEDVLQLLVKAFAEVGSYFRSS